MIVSELIKGVKGVKVRGNSDKEITDLVSSSAAVSEGSVFFAYKGEVSDGRDYVADAVSRGAAAVVTDRETPDDITEIIVPDVRSAMSYMAYRFYKPTGKRVKVIGVVGTNGKTTITYIIKNVLDAAGKNAGVIGTLGIKYGKVNVCPELTTPDAITLMRTLKDMADCGVEYAVMELSAHAIALKRAQALKFAALVFTNCTRDHLDYFNCFDEYEKTKMSVFTRKNCDFCVINADDATGRKIIDRTDAKTYTYGLKNPSDVFSVNVECDLKGSSFVMNVFDDIACFDFCLTGEYNVYNCMAAALTCYVAGVPLSVINKAVASMVRVDGRGEFVESYNGADVFVDYAHTPDGLENVLKTFRELTDGKLYVVFGCGGNRDKEKRPEMGRIAGSFADFSVITSDNPRFEDPYRIISDIESGIRRVTRSYITIQNRRLAIRYALGLLNKGDVLLICGKGAEDYQDVMGVKTEFNDKKAIGEIVAGLDFGIDAF